MALKGMNLKQFDAGQTNSEKAFTLCVDLKAYFILITNTIIRLATQWNTIYVSKIIANCFE